MSANTVSSHGLDQGPKRNAQTGILWFALVLKVQGANVDVVGSLPVTDRFGVFARVGYTYSFVKDEFAGYGAVVALDPQRREDGSHYKYGIGLQYAVTESFGLRAEAERYRIDDAVGNKGDIDLLSAGVVFRFGRAAPPPVPPPMVAAEPPPPPPEPVIAPPAPAPARKKVSFSADSLFDFGKDTIKNAGRQALDAFAGELRDTRFDVITVTGYTDRIGSHDYNVALSARRADTVKSYLVQSAGIPADKVTTRGADGSEPVTRPDDCKGQRRTPALIACLQPDRRVDVEVVGTQAGSAPVD
jgi:OOP family OmpA-OmpF porin